MKKSSFLAAGISLAIAACGGGNGGDNDNGDAPVPTPKKSVLEEKYGWAGEGVPIAYFAQPQAAGGSILDLVLNKTPNARPTKKIELTFEGNGCGDFKNQVITQQETILSAKIGEQGRCTVHAIFTLADGTMTDIHSTVNIININVPLPKFTIVDGYYEDNMPLATFLTQQHRSLNGFNIESIDISPVVNGGRTTIRVKTSHPNGINQIKKIYITQPGRQDYFAVNAVLDSNGYLTATLNLNDDFFENSSNKQEPLNLEIALADERSNATPVKATSTKAVSVGSGSLQFSLNWDTSSDVDLHVVQPNNNELYYSSRNDSTTGGRLDLDSNANCNIDNINNENVTWQQGQPLAGKYIVRVDYYRACAITKPTNYKLTVRNCGKIQEYKGIFNPNEEDRGKAGSGRTIAEIDYVPCHAYKVSGKAQFNKFIPTVNGLSTTAVPTPIRNADIEVRSAINHKVLAKGSTNKQGNYSLSYDNVESNLNVYVAVKTEQSNQTDQPTQIVSTAPGQAPYEEKSAIIDPTKEPQKQDANINVTNASIAPAFNIFDLGTKGLAFIQNTENTMPAKLTWQWRIGEPACDSSASCYESGKDLIKILSVSTDNDEYDDAVLLHELGHFYHKYFSKKNNAGGPHSSKNRVNPELAWNEGSATFFGNWILGNNLYIDTNNRATLNFDLDHPQRYRVIPKGTDNGTALGNMSEAYVAAIMWDLADKVENSTDQNGQDRIGNINLVMNAFRAMKTKTLRSSGVTLTDFLDYWTCQQYSSKDDLNELVNKLNYFPYDYQAKCN